MSIRTLDARRRPQNAGLFGFVGAWNDRVAERRKLACLDNRLLRDMGVSTQDRVAECRKPFWRR